MPIFRPLIHSDSTIGARLKSVVELGVMRAGNCLRLPVPASRSKASAKAAIEWCAALALVLFTVACCVSETADAGLIIGVDLLVSITAHTLLIADGCLSDTVGASALNLNATLSCFWFALPLLGLAVEEALVVALTAVERLTAWEELGGAGSHEGCCGEEDFVHCCCIGEIRC